MDQNDPTPETQSRIQKPAEVSASTWLRTPITLTVERWMLVAAGIAAVVLLLVALD